MNVQDGGRPIRTGIIGFGTGGRVFHGPLLAADPAFEVTAVVTADPGRRAQAAKEHPGAAVLRSAEELFAEAGRLDLVVVTTPPGSHYELASAALARGLAVVVDKPFTVRAEQGRELIAEAERLGLLLTVFHNRRYDGDFRTVRRLVAGGSLGEVRTFESRFEWCKPDEPKAWKAQALPADGGGMLFDLGPHLLDQALRLFGPVACVHAELTRYRPGPGGDDEAFVSLVHESGVRSHLAMSSLAPLERPRFTIAGSAAGFVKWGLDCQEQQLAAGVGPGDAAYGREPEERWGRLGGRDGQSPVPTEPGGYPDFYDELAAALSGGGAPPVAAGDALAVIELIEQIYATTDIRRGH
ncbi:Myo-inositol 2-dehydrogenase [[Actinomadura] parvosata subsp. kistnae]|uniref:Gfo/Idh/MocA family protein n=1 Tax=[Actinomadura] parvosata TaxID=1955412 RepID=UPI000D2C443C|nr:Gfo/Idh/MocA family oxidoreductase [Nonomuraea sp. ATCC 55076]SPL88660.1 Myo-inositol 2-dehydrogenase [Actinomadura parvosata subsp. kistnae]